MDNLAQIQSLLRAHKSNSNNTVVTFFKTGAGQYAEHDQFIGISVPVLRMISKNFLNLNMEEIQALLGSKFNEERLLSLFNLIFQYQKATHERKNEIYEFYLNNLQYVNNWNLVDASAHLIVGAHLMNFNKEKLIYLAGSENIWERRVAIVATWYFIRHKDLEWTFKIAEILLNDTHDLIHKAVGWMLREAGKRDEQQLINFLNQYAIKMPRTMLRYAIEKFSPEQRKFYLNIGKF